MNGEISGAGGLPAIAIASGAIGRWLRFGASLTRGLRIRRRRSDLADHRPSRLAGRTAVGLWPASKQREDVHRTTSRRFSLRMILSENRLPLFGIMRCSEPAGRRSLPGSPP
jgi:hypothetical protein